MGTWSIPDTDEKRREIEIAILELTDLKRRLYTVFGDDTLFDHIDNAIFRLKQGRVIGELNEGD